MVKFSNINGLLIKSSAYLLKGESYIQCEKEFCQLSREVDITEKNIKLKFEYFVCNSRIVLRKNHILIWSQKFNFIDRHWNTSEIDLDLGKYKVKLSY